jgi:hypothetical protein
MLTPVSTSWRFPDKLRNMRAACSSSRGLPRIWSSTTTVVSAPRTTISPGADGLAAGRGLAEAIRLDSAAADLSAARRLT